MSFLSKMICILMITSLSCIANSEPVKKASLDSLIILSGIDSQVRDETETIHTLLQSLIGSYPKATVTKISELFKESLDPDSLLTDIQSEIGKTLTEGQALELLTWYESNLGNRIASAEEYASSAEGVSEMEELSKSLLLNTERVEYAKKFMEAIGSLEDGWEGQKYIMLVGMVIAAKSANPDKPVNQSELETLLESRKEMMTKVMEGIMLPTIVFAYKDFDASELDTYIEVLKQPTMSAFNKASSKGVSNAMINILEKLGS
jgi:hypothetical protein